MKNQTGARYLARQKQERQELIQEIQPEESQLIRLKSGAVRRCRAQAPTIIDVDYSKLEQLAVRYADSFPCKSIYGRNDCKDCLNKPDCKEIWYSETEEKA